MVFFCKMLNEVKIKPKLPSHPRITPLRFLATIYGLYPVVLTSDMKAKVSYFLVVYGGILNISVSFGRFYLEPSPPVKTFVSSVQRVQNILLPLSYITTTLFMFIHMKKFLKFFSEILQLVQYMSAAHLKQAMHIQIIVISVGYTLYIIEVVVEYLVRKDSWDSTRIAIKALKFFLDTAMLLVKLQFFASLFHLRNLLCRVQSDLRKPDFINVNFLAELYERALSLGEIINQCFGVSIGVVAIMTTLNCISTAYFFIAQSGTDYRLLLWILIDVSQIWMVITSAVLFTYEASRVGVAVHEALRTARDVRIKDQLKDFSLFILHRPAKFSLCGMVPLDYSVLFAIAGAVTTYMIVLVQFQRTDSN